MARTADGAKLDEGTEPEAVCWCVNGAFNRVVKDKGFNDAGWSSWALIRTKAEKLFKVDSLAMLNDDFGYEGYEAVMRVLNATINDLELEL